MSASTAGSSPSTSRCVSPLNGDTSQFNVVPSFLTLCQTLLERGDPRLAFTCRVHLDGSKQAAAVCICSAEHYVCYRATGDIKIDGRLDDKSLAGGALDRRLRGHRGRPTAQAAFADAGQDALGRQAIFTSPPSWKSRTSGARSPSTTRSSSWTTISRSSSTRRAAITTTASSRSTPSTPAGTCSSRSRIATAARRTLAGKSPA